MLEEQKVLSLLQNDITEKETLVGHEQFNMFIRYQYIQAIDRKWLDQLEYLDSLREAVHLRGYGQHNPLTEYKIDGFNQFDAMIEKIRIEIAGRVFKVRIQITPAAQPPRQAMQGNAQHSEAQSMSEQARGAQMARNAQQQAGRTMAGASTGQSVTVVRTGPKIGRNDPCPCGSGKKYKNCHGR